MNGGKAPACLPTWRGHIETTKDALIIFEACFNGTLAHCFRRPHDRERNHLIVSGNVFVYEEATSGIKRWTDGIPWSPSRILTNFLIYRQLNNPFPPGEKKRATKRGQRSTRPGDPYPTTSPKTGANEDGFRFSPASPATPGLKPEENGDKDANRGLLGSLIDSYEFKKDGLLKKTMTVVINNVQHHLVSYYSLEDAKYNLETPRSDPRLKDIHLREELLNQPKFKFPNYDDAGDGGMEQIDAVQQHSYGYYPTAFETTRQLTMAPHGHSTHQEPSTQMFYPAMTQYVDQHHHPNSHIYGTMPPTTSTYMAMPSAPAPYSQLPHQHPTQHAGQYPIAPPVYQPGLPQVQIPSQQNSHPVTHQMQTSYQPTPQFSTLNQPLHRPAPQYPYPEQQIQPVGFSSQPTQSLLQTTPNLSQPMQTHMPTLPRPMFEFVSPTQENYNQSHELYSHSSPNGTPSNDSAVVLPQPWQMPGSPPYGIKSDPGQDRPYRPPA